MVELTYTILQLAKVKTILKAIVKEIKRQIKHNYYNSFICKEQPVPFDFHGHTYYLNPEKTAIYHIEQSTQKIKNLVDVIESEPKIIFDIGANCGLFSAFANKRFPQASIHSFEPSQDLIPIMSMNCKNNTIINQLAVGSENREIDLFVNKNSQQTNSLNKKAVTLFCKEKNLETRKINIITLDGYCNTRNIDRIDVLKIDVQGYEGDVLKGAKNILKSVNMVLIESTWIDIESIKNIFDFALRYHFNYLGVANDVYLGADLILAKEKFASNNRLISTFEINRELLTSSWS